MGRVWSAGPHPSQAQRCPHGINAITGPALRHTTHSVLEASRLSTTNASCSLVCISGTLGLSFWILRQHSCMLTYTHDPGSCLVVAGVHYHACYLPVVRDEIIGDHCEGPNLIQKDATGPNIWSLGQPCATRGRADSRRAKSVEERKPHVLLLAIRAKFSELMRCAASLVFERGIRAQRQELRLCVRQLLFDGPVQRRSFAVVILSRSSHTLTSVPCTPLAPLSSLALPFALFPLPSVPAVLPLPPSTPRPHTPHLSPHHAHA